MTEAGRGERGREPPGGEARDAGPAHDETQGHATRGGGAGAPSAGGSSPDLKQAQARLDALRAEMSDLTDRLIQLVGQRLDLAVEIGAAKSALGLPVLDPAREARVVRDAAARARELGVDPEMVRDIVWRIISAAREAQGGPRPGWPDPESAGPRR